MAETPSDTSSNRPVTRASSALKTSSAPPTPPSHSNKDALPEPFYTFFTLVEPLLTLGGAFYALVLPEACHINQMPTPWFEPVSVPVHPAAISTLHVYGNVLCILAAMSAFFLPAVVKSPGIPLEVKQSLLTRFFLILAVADWTHILWSLWDLGNDVAFLPSRWNLLAFGNIGITVGLFLFRMAYFVLADDMVKSKKD